MSNEGGVMRMRRVDSLDLPAGKTVALEPGGYHVMLLDINRPLKAGEHVAVTLVIEEGGKRFELPVRSAGALACWTTPTRTRIRSDSHQPRLCRLTSRPALR